MFTFLEFLHYMSESARRSALHGFGNFGTDWKKALVAKDAVIDGGEYHDVAMYAYRVNQFVQERLNKLKDFETATPNHEFNGDGEDHLGNVNSDAKLHKLRKAAEYLDENIKQMMDNTTARNKGKRDVVSNWRSHSLEEVHNAFELLMEACDELANDRRRPQIMTQIVAQIAAYLRKTDVINFIEQRYKDLALSGKVEKLKYRNYDQ